MQKFAMLAVLALCLLAVNTQAADGPHSTIKDAKVGDWVEYKITAGTGGRNIEMTSKQTCTARDETSVTEKKEMTVMGHSNSMEVKIDLTASAALVEGRPVYLEQAP